MGDRYWMTGVQLGILKGLIKSNEYEDADLMIDDIIDKQMLFIDEELAKKRLKPSQRTEGEGK